MGTKTLQSQNYAPSIYHLIDKFV